MPLPTRILLVLDPGNLPTVQVYTAKPLPFCSRSIENADPLLLCVRTMYCYQSTSRFCWVWEHPSVPICTSGFLAFPFIVIYRFPTVNCKMLTFLCNCLFLMYWPPLYFKPRRTDSLPHQENESQRSVHNFWSSILGNQNGNWMQTFINEVSTAVMSKIQINTLPAPIWKWTSQERRWLLALHNCQSEWWFIFRHS